MKRLTALILCVALLLFLGGCAGKKGPLQKPVAFYYRTAEVIYDGKTAMIGFEERESAGYEDNMIQLLNVYFAGPSSEKYRSPFPANLKAVSYSVLGSAVILELSSEFAQLSGVDLTIACACIAGTILSMTELDRVQISAADTPLDGQASIIMNRGNVLLLDMIGDPAETQEAAIDPKQ